MRYHDDVIDATLPSDVGHQTRPATKVAVERSRLPWPLAAAAIAALSILAWLAIAWLARDLFWR